MPADHHLKPQKTYTLDLKQQARPLTTNHLSLGGTNLQGETIAFTNYYIEQNGRPGIPIMGEFHASRSPHQFWKDELLKLRAGGVTIVASYIFWIHVEEEEGTFDWSGDRDIRAFVAECQHIGLPVMLRIGPFVHAECRNGGLPDWLYGRGIAVRSNDERYLFYVRRYFAEIAEQVKGLLFEDGGPVIGIQIENEYRHAGAPWEVPYKPGSEWVPAGVDGAEHLQILKELAIEVGLRAPIYACTAWGGAAVPEHDFLPMQAGYAFTPWVPDPYYQQEPTREFLFRDRRAQPRSPAEIDYDVTRYPYAYSELGAGTQITYQHRPIIPPECVQAIATVALGSGTNLLGYYMYHGGSNPVGKHSYLNEFTVPRISYDFQAPIREYGQLNESYHRLRALHLFLQEFGGLLAPMPVSVPGDGELLAPEDISALRYAVRSKDGSGFLFLNNYQDHVEMRDNEGIHLRLELPGESLYLPRGYGLTLRKNASAILPFNLHLKQDVLLKYATAQLLTTIQEPAQTTCVFFAPQGMRAEFALDRTTYRNIEVTAGAVEEEQERDYVTVEPGLQCRVDITALDGSHLHLLVLTQEQAFTCWKVQFGGEERLVLSEELVLSQDNGLRLHWHDRSSTSLAIYPPLTHDILLSEGNLTESIDGFFTCYSITVPEHTIDLEIERPCPDTLHIRIPATALDGICDALLRINYFGDTGHAYLDGRLVGDNFANGLPWEIGLKRFIIPGMTQELVIRISPLQQDAAWLRYFPDRPTPSPTIDGTLPVEVYSISAVPEYQATLLTRKEKP